eukprot:TRINITY_DN9891_c0_g2_i1.p2 TRINITY_DN9891_c0_g2~~TRINITY_DN9891_c0_g2_i1.p2  ORF type:complete len:102 (+),score=18.88 TRINITY_DN9891_c0_g2_i1:121-426(+)
MAGVEGGEFKDPASAHNVGVVEEGTVLDAANGRNICIQEQKAERLNDKFRSMQILTSNFLETGQLMTRRRHVRQAAPQCQQFARLPRPCTKSLLRSHKACK